MFDNTDFNFSYDWKNNGNVLYVNHFWVSDENRGYGRASAILETLVRIAYYESAEVIEVSIGGGEKAEEFINRNGFHIINRRSYEFDIHESSTIEGEYGIDAVRRV